MNKVFVYGTLKAGYCNHVLLEGYEGKKGFAPGIALYAGAMFPFAKQGGGMARGEIYDVSDSTLKELDRLEGHPNFYRRELTGVYDEKFNRHKAWIYLYGDAERFPKIEGGEWLGNTQESVMKRFKFIQKSSVKC